MTLLRRERGARRTRSSRWPSLAGGVLAALSFVSGCASPQLVPVVPVLNGVARASNGSIVVLADARAPRPWSLPASVTPIRISVRNQGQSGVHVALGDIELRGESEAVRAELASSIVPRPSVTSLGVDPGSPLAYQGQSGPGVVLPADVYGVGGPNWLAPRDSGRPSEIESMAFSGGYVDAGQSRSGFVYFGDLPGDGETLTLRIVVRSGESSGAVWNAELPFHVSG